MFYGSYIYCQLREMQVRSGNTHLRLNITVRDAKTMQVLARRHYFSSKRGTEKLTHGKGITNLPNYKFRFILNED